VLEHLMSGAKRGCAKGRATRLPRLHRQMLAAVG